MLLPGDPRHHNRRFNLDSIEAHIKNYADPLSSAPLSIDRGQHDLAVAEIEGARMRGARLWVAGNGGSAAIADHLLCDWVKGTFTASHPPIHVHPLVSGTALLTACANDFGYEASFSRQPEMQAQPSGVLICISSSANSANILAALRKAKTMRWKTIALIGFSGGESTKLADIRLHVALHNYGIGEDCHQILMRNIAQYVYGRFGVI